MANKSVSKLTKKIDKQEYDVEWANDRILYIPINKKEKAEMLKKFVYREVGNAWKLEDPRLVTLKRQFLTELLNSLLL
jgi:UDP-galactopyranose mutase